MVICTRYSLATAIKILYVILSLVWNLPIYLPKKHLKVSQTEVIFHFLEWLCNIKLLMMLLFQFGLRMINYVSIMFQIIIL